MNEDVDKINKVGDKSRYEVEKRGQEDCGIVFVCICVCIRACMCVCMWVCLTERHSDRGSHLRVS